MMARSRLTSVAVAVTVFSLALGAAIVGIAGSGRSPDPSDGAAGRAIVFEPAGRRLTDADRTGQGPDRATPFDLAALDPGDPAAQLAAAVLGDESAPVARPRNPDRAAGRKGERAGREEWLRHAREYPAGRVPDDAFARAVAAADLPVWENVGPAPIRQTNLGDLPIDANGRSTAIVVDPRNADVAYAGTSLGGVWKTTDGGASWRNLTGVPLPNRQVSDLAYHPRDHQTIYLAYAGFAANTPTTPGHVFKTTDGGRSWVDLSVGLPDGRPGRSSSTPTCRTASISGPISASFGALTAGSAGRRSTRAYRSIRS